MNRRGRPLRFLAIVIGGWSAARIAIVWHATGSLPQAIEAVAPIAVASRAAPAVERVPARVATAWVGHARRDATAGAGHAAIVSDSPDATRVQLALLGLVRFDAPIALATPAEEPSAGQGDPPTIVAPLHVIQPPARARLPLTLSAWAIARGGGGLASAPGTPQLGGGQAGLRAEYMLGRGIALAGRLAGSLDGTQREAALGVSYRPSGSPIRATVERRFGLAGVRPGTALTIDGGLYDRRLAGRFRLEGYGQAGAIARDHLEGFVDGAVRAARPIARIGRVAFDLGGGAWGGAQRGASRLDIGPSLAARAPLAETTMRIGLDWRERVAGRARPGSGAVVSIGADF